MPAELLSFLKLNSGMLPKIAGAPSMQSNKTFFPVYVWLGIDISPSEDNDGLRSLQKGLTE